MNNNVRKHKGIEGMNYGIIDIGSNTVRIVVYRVDKGKFEYLFNEKRFVQLINHIENGAMKDAGISALICSLQHMQNMALRFNLKALKCFATAPFRAVKDIGHLVGIVKKFTGIDVDVLSGEEEARLGVIGARHQKDINDGLFADLGGGSMEISMLRAGEIIYAQSIDLGCVSLSGKFVSGILPDRKEIKELKAYADDQLSKLKWLKCAEGFDLYCLGGTARALCRIHQSMEGRYPEINGYSIPAKEIKNVCKYIVEMNTEGIRLLTKICPGRIFTFVPGALVLWRLAKISDVRNAYFSTYGIREGYLMERVMPEMDCEPNDNKTEEKRDLLVSNIQQVI